MTFAWQTNSICHKKDLYLLPPIIELATSVSYFITNQNVIFMLNTNISIERACTFATNIRFFDELLKCFSNTLYNRYQDNKGTRIIGACACHKLMVSPNNRNNGGIRVHHDYWEFKWCKIWHNTSILHKQCKETFFHGTKCRIIS